MFSLTIAFGPGNGMWTLMWREKEKADAAWDALALAKAANAVLQISDEFGQECVSEIAAVHGAMLEDLNLSKLAHIERALHQARVQAEGQTMAESDHVLRAARARQGSAILTPGIPGNGMLR